MPGDEEHRDLGFRPPTLRELWRALNAPRGVDGAAVRYASLTMLVFYVIAIFVRPAPGPLAIWVRCRLLHLHRHRGRLRAAVHVARPATVHRRSGADAQLGHRLGGADARSRSRRPRGAGHDHVRADGVPADRRRRADRRRDPRRVGDPGRGVRRAGGGERLTARAVRRPGHGRADGARPHSVSRSHQRQHHLVAGRLHPRAGAARVCRGRGAATRRDGGGARAGGAPAPHVRHRPLRHRRHRCAWRAADARHRRSVARIRAGRRRAERPAGRARRPQPVGAGG